MNDGDDLPLPPGHDDVDAVLDGDATPEQRARVAADPDLARALAARRWLREELAEVPPLPPDVADGAVAAALAAAEEGARGAGALDDGRVAPLRRRWAPALTAVAGWVGAAAVFVALVLGGAAVLGSGSDDGDAASGPPPRPEQLAASATTVGGAYQSGAGGSQPTEGAADAARPTADDSARSSSSSTTAAGASTSTVPSSSPLGDLGALDDPDAVRAAVEARGLTRSPPPSAQAAAAACPVAGADGGTSAAVATVTYDGIPAQVQARWRADGTADELLVVASADCRVLVTIPLR